MTLCWSTNIPIKIPSKHKSKTWKFAGVNFYYGNSSERSIGIW